MDLLTGSGITPLMITFAVFALLLIVLTTIAATTVIVNRHRPTIAQAVRAEERREKAEVQLEALEAQINEKRAILTDADKKASEVAWLEERLEGLRLELNEVEPRRRELLDLNTELERALAELGDATRTLDEKSGLLEKVSAAEQQIARLEAEVDVAEERRERLLREVEDIEHQREEAFRVRADLKNVLAEIEEQRERREEIAGRVAHLQARQDGLEEAKQDIDAVEQVLRDAREESSRLRAQISADETTIETLSARKAQLDGLIGGLEAQAESRRDEIAGGDGKPAADPMSDLREPPQVINMLRAKSFAEGRPEDATEASHLRRVRASIKAAGLSFHPRIIWAFHTALKTSPEAPMTVLAGISGTGKTQLPRRYAEGMGIGFLPMPVQPRWDSPQDLLGFYNFIEKRYKATELSRALFQLDGQGENAEILQDRMLLVLLDEMNLARVEYYFSEFLSRLEMRPPPDVDATSVSRSAAEIVIEAPGGHEARIYPGHNVLFAGTMNEDESTQALSDKVLDRGNMLRFPAPKDLSEAIRIGTAPEITPMSFTRWRAWRRSIATHDRRAWAEETVTEFAKHMRNLGRPFGYRVSLAILSYVANYPVHDGAATVSVADALADQVEMRLLPKLRGVELEEKEDDLHRLADYVRERLDDEKLAEAIDESIDQSRETDRFAWSGLAR